MIYVLPDNTILEIVSSDCPHGPDGEKYGKIGKPSNWYRINNGKWNKSPYRTEYQFRMEINGTRSFEHLREKLNNAMVGCL